MIGWRCMLKSSASQKTVPQGLRRLSASVPNSSPLGVTQ